MTTEQALGDLGNLFGSEERARMVWVYLLLAIAAEVVATSALKASESFTRIGPSVIVVLGYGAAFYLLSLTFRTLPVGVVYAIWSGVGIVLISLVGWIAFRQNLDAPAVIGIALIVAGVVVINLLSKSLPH
jgi:small multidrug resistance pump